MSFVQAGDIIMAVKFAHKVCVLCLTENNKADVRYQELVNDIKHLKVQLDRLCGIFENASKPQRNALPGKRRASASVGTAVAVQEGSNQTRQLLGDFCRTLEDCNAFMANNAVFATRGNRTIKTAGWYASGREQQSQHLRTRIQFHCTKIAFLLGPLHTELLAHISWTMDIMLDYQRKIYGLISGRNPGAGELPAVPEDLAIRYEYVSQQPDQRPFSSSEQYPLEESIDALLFHYGRADIDGLNAQVATTKQLNEFLKTQWILDNINRHPKLQRLMPLSRSIVTKIEEQVQLQYQFLRPDFITEHARIIVTWQPVYFRIWFQEDIAITPPPAHVARHNEEKILQLELQDDSQGASKQLHLFRQSDTEYRLLETTASEPGTKQVINTHHWRCIPWYAVPNGPGSARSFQLCHNNVHDGDLFTLRRDEDAFAFQQALTNYRVRYNEAKVEWSLQRQKKKRLFSSELKGSEKWSGIQIWEYEPLEDIETPAAPAFEAPVSSRKSSTLAKTLAGVLPSRAGSITVNQDSGDASIFSRARPGPVLVLFTKYESKPTYLYIPLTSGLDCNRQRCGCVDLASDCSVVVMENGLGKRDPFGLHVHQVATSSAWADWNLLLFADPKPPAFKALPIWDDAKALSLGFATSTARKEFQRELFGVLRRRNLQRSGRADPQALAALAVQAAPPAEQAPRSTWRPPSMAGSALEVPRALSPAMSRESTRMSVSPSPPLSNVSPFSSPSPFQTQFPSNAQSPFLAQRDSVSSRHDSVLDSPWAETPHPMGNSAPSYSIEKPALASPIEMAASSSPVEKSASSYRAEMGASSSPVEMSATLYPTELATEPLYPVNQRYLSELSSEPRYPTELASDPAHPVHVEQRYPADKMVEPTVVELDAAGSAPARAGPPEVLVAELEDSFRINFRAKPLALQ